MRKVASLIVLLLLLNLAAPVYSSAAENTEKTSSQTSEVIDQDKAVPVTSQDDVNLEAEVETQDTKAVEAEKTEAEKPVETEMEKSTEEASTKQVTPESLSEENNSATENDEEVNSAPEEKKSEDEKNAQEASTSEDKDTQATEEVPEKKSVSSSSISEAENVLEWGSTSKLGHLGNNSRIYADLASLSSYKVAKEAGLTNAVYYAKQQAKRNGELFYRISTQPHSGVVGWVKASEFNERTHKSISNDRKTLYVKGTGEAYTKAWGGSKDKVYTLSSLKGEKFEVNLTETVGTNTWYRGMLNGKNVFIHSAYLTTSPKGATVSATSKLGHLGNSSRIYTDLSNLSSYKVAKDTGLTNAVYYAKQQADLNGELFYKISTQPSSTHGVVGWVKASQFNERTHKSISNDKKTLYVKGTGEAFTKAWGGSKDKVYTLSSLKGEKFEVNLTETVGTNTWYRGMLNGKNVFIHSSYVKEIVAKESSTSKLGHLGNDSRIYADLSNLSSYKVAKEAGLTNAVYYAKLKADLNGELYYKISTQPSSTHGVVGWVKASEFNERTHKSISNDRKTLYVKGSGEAFTKAWGGSKNKVYTLSSLKGEKFEVNLTETVGTNTWYRGMLNGKNVFIHSSYVESYKDIGVESSTSRLGHLKKDAVVYKHWYDQSEGRVASEANLTDTVYYVKRQVQAADEVFYLISLEPSAKNGVVGWVRSGDLNSRSHKGIDKEHKTFYVNGKGTSYTKAWGGSKDIVKTDLSDYAGETFSVTLTERVGSNVWYRGVMNNKTMWLHESFVTESYQRSTQYDLTLQEAIDIQKEAGAQTDNEYSAYVSMEYIDNSKVTADLLNVRGGPSKDYWILGTLSKDSKVNIIGKSGSWYKIEFTGDRQWVNASPSDIAYYLNPNNFLDNEKQKFQFLDLTRSSGIDKETLNAYIEKKAPKDSTLRGQAEAFIEASKLYGINDIYLVSHALLETGNGTSSLAKGNTYKGKTVYNMYGIGAFDECPLECGVKRAYEEGWFTPYDAIVGGAQYIGNDYIKNGQNTLYKMRWNPNAMANLGKASHQYATDIGWASKQVSTMFNLYQEIGVYTLYLDIPHYN
ncbi:N-acetylglucosaminidase [Terribacillus halophilus]|jgi:mannosyl-glycoprotein endo-beta-N-acetylglucosaminidase|uniref:N-acetylglucosaminidase n=1 Tax=Terribacillus halophilus TaxID=361279 RepID=UPI00117C65DE|nr:SH3 domain-containing protein [Terribacillus halophilus]